MLDAPKALSHLGLSPPGTTGTHGAKGGRQVSQGRGCGIWGGAWLSGSWVLGMCMQTRAEIWVWCKSGSRDTGAEGKIRAGEESCRGEASSASRLLSVTVIDVGEEGDAYKEV